MATPDDYWLGFDLGGTKMLAAVFDGNFQILGRERKKTKGHEGAEAVLDRVARVIRGALESAGISADQLSGIGIGCPGPVDQEKGIVREAVNLAWENVPLAKILKEKFQCPVMITNDVDAGVYGEYRFGAGRDARTVLGIFPGTGIGGGCVYDGEILHGKQTSCLEIGHIQVTPDGRLCGCGRRGCLETEASRLAIATDAAAAAFRGEAPHLHRVAGTDVAKIRSSVLAQAIRDGDRAVEEIVIKAAQRLGTSIASVIHLLAPDVVVLGGGLVEAMPDLFVKHARKAAEAAVMSSFVKTFRVEVAQLGDDASVFGSAAWVERRVRQLAANSPEPAGNRS